MHRSDHDLQYAWLHPILVTVSHINRDVADEPLLEFVFFNLNLTSNITHNTAHDCNQFVNEVHDSMLGSDTVSFIENFDEGDDRYSESTGSGGGVDW